MSDGLLFVGVDGVLNPWDVPRGRELPGYETFYRYREFNPGGYTAPTVWGLGPVQRGGTRVRLNREHGCMLREVAERWSLELVWATWWGDDAPRLIAPVLGLPEMRVVPLYPGTNRPGENWKRWAVNSFADGRPFGWLDDEFGAGDYVWAANRQLKKCIPTFVWNVDPREGLTWQAVKMVDTYFWGLS